jgi:hypothetical protein
MALQALATPIERYRSSVVATVEEVRGYLSGFQSKAEARDGNVAARWGSFAVGRLDFDRLSAIVAEPRAESLDTLRKVEKAFDVLRVIAAGENDLYQVRLKTGSRLRDAVAGRLSEIGRGFAAARLAGRAARGALDSEKAEDLLQPLPFERWTQAERRIAPPLLVELDGAELRPAELAEFMDGGLKILLVVQGDAPPASLVRLITPGTFVLQTADQAGLERWAAFEGPGIAALVSGDACARFVHDPAGGAEIWQRLDLWHLPDTRPAKALGALSARQQQEELEQLRALARGPAAAGAPAAGAAGTGPAAVNPVDRLATWLLSQADLKGLG